MTCNEQWKLSTCKGGNLDIRLERTFGREKKAKRVDGDGKKLLKCDVIRGEKERGKGDAASNEIREYHPFLRLVPFTPYRLSFIPQFLSLLLLSLVLLTFPSLFFPSHSPPFPPSPLTLFPILPCTTSSPHLQTLDFPIFCLLSTSLSYSLLIPLPYTYPTSYSLTLYLPHPSSPPYTLPTPLNPLIRFPFPSWVGLQWGGGGEGGKGKVKRARKIYWKIQQRQSHYPVMAC